MNSRLQYTCVALLAGMSAAYAQTPPHTIYPEPAAIGISANESAVLFSQPYCDGPQNGLTNLPRGIYQLNVSSPSTTNPLVPLPASSSCTENYFTNSAGLGNFPADTLYIAGLLNGSRVIFSAPATGGTPQFFSNLPVATAPTPHAALTFDTVGTFAFNLIATGEGGVQGYDHNGNLTFSYANPQPSNFWLEGATVAPQSYTPCPGCLFIVAEALNSPNGAIYVVHPGAPSGIVPEFFAAGPREPENIIFVPATPCSVNGNSYYVSAYSQGPGNPQYSNGGAILGFTAAQLAAYAGQFLVPDEASGVIYAYAGPSSTVFSNTGYQLEAATMVSCGGGGTTGGGPQTDTVGWMTGGGQMASFAASHGMELGCSTTSNHHNLEVNWAGGNQFHLTSISSVTCYLDTTIGAPNPPGANFNTLSMTGVGTYDGHPGATVTAMFTDEGEPGTKDMAMIVVKYNGSTVLQIPLAKIATGNQQAHK
jgi:hypothetical protein